MVNLDPPAVGLIASRVERAGFTLVGALRPDLTTLQIARRLGPVVDLPRIIEGGHIPSIQPLRPRESSTANLHRYSGNYGLNSFPLHSDLAHWALPPHFLILRCVVGADDVYTKILRWTSVTDLVDNTALRKAVFRARQSPPGRSGLVRALSSHEGDNVFRWDPLFIQPLNSHARFLGVSMHFRTDGTRRPLK